MPYASITPTPPKMNATSTGIGWSPSDTRQSASRQISSVTTSSINPPVRKTDATGFDSFASLLSPTSSALPYKYP